MRAWLSLGLATVSLWAATEWSVGAASRERPEKNSILSLSVRPLGAGNPKLLSDLTAGKPLVVFFTSPSCPISKRLAPEQAAIEKAFAGKGVQFLFVNPSGADTPAELEAFATQNGFRAPLVHDSTGRMALALNGSTTTECFLLNATGKLIYHGAINDQYGIGTSLPKARNHFLRDAIKAMLSGSSVAKNQTEAPGCFLNTSSAMLKQQELTYHRDIAPIIKANCGSCHRTGGLAPFALDSYQAVASRSAMLKAVIESKVMPPWSASPPAIGDHSPWMNDRSLSPADHLALITWLSGSKLEGSAPKEVSKPEPIPEWNIGKPDLILQLPKPIKVQATGFMDYEELSIDPGVSDEKWISAVEIRPTDPSVVHHVLVWAIPKGQKFDQALALSGFFAGYVPGNSYQIFPSGFAKKFPANSRIVLQIHYTPNGKATEDQLKLGLKFADKPPVHELKMTAALKLGIKIPPGAERHEEVAIRNIPVNAKITAFMPHMHVRGVGYRYELKAPDGSRKTLLDIPNYDFNWQHLYRYKEPMPVVAGSQIIATAWYDNSATNRANPDPTKTVRWGDQTFDEMMLGYIEYYLD